MRLAFITASLFAACIAFAGDKKEKPAQVPSDFIRWAHSWDEAVAEAKERNVPIHVAFHKDH